MSDVEDWTAPITLVSGGPLGVDYPDWTQAVEDTGGGGAGYASLTGTGQTTTPGDLTQQGGLEVFCNSTAVGFEVQANTNTVSINGGQVFLTALSGITMDVNTSFSVSGGAMHITSSASAPIVICANNTVSGGSDGCITLQFATALILTGPTNVATATTHLFVNQGNPNTVISAIGVGDVCIDTITPGIWQATNTGLNHWTQYTFP